ncbi:MAG TPA: PilZ domain-containing protein [Verrucomicrobiae bacterium]|nr:PilZ domain-containing protein [Verrucomicrobiae bacterium]
MQTNVWGGDLAAWPFIQGEPQWESAREDATSLPTHMLGMTENGKHNRRFPRIATPSGVWVAWQQDGQKQSVSRVCDLNIGGLFIATPKPASVGTVISVLFSVPEGEIRGHATVRNFKAGEGMGVQFTAMGGQDTDRLRKLVARLLDAASSQQA